MQEQRAQLTGIDQVGKGAVKNVGNGGQGDRGRKRKNINLNNCMVYRKEHIFGATSQENNLG